MRKSPLITDQYYHVFTRSIAKFIIFNNDADYIRIQKLLNIYRFNDLPYKYSKFITLSPEYQKAIMIDLEKSANKRVDVIAYCPMPTHVHLILKQLIDDGISDYMRSVLDSYTRYFNIKHNRKGPLYEHKFEDVLIESDEQLLHTTRYLHINPTSAGLVEKPEDWKFSSYREYIGKEKKGFCHFNDIMQIDPEEYRKFVCDRIGYQKELSKIKNLLIDDYSG